MNTSSPSWHAKTLADRRTGADERPVVESGGPPIRCGLSTFGVQRQTCCFATTTSPSATDSLEDMLAPTPWQGPTRPTDCKGRPMRKQSHRAAAGSGSVQGNSDSAKLHRSRPPGVASGRRHNVIVYAREDCHCARLEGLGNTWWYTWDWHCNRLGRRHGCQSCAVAS